MPTFLNLNWKDILKGMILLFGSSLLSSLMPLMGTGVWPNWTQFQPILFTSIAAVLVYFSKNVFTNNAPIQRSRFLNLNWLDLLWGILITIGSSIISSIVPILETGTWITWVAFKPIMMTSLMAGATYILKNFFTNNQNELLKKE